MRNFFRSALPRAAVFVALASSLGPAALAVGPTHALAAAMDNHPFAIEDARGHYLALHFLPAAVTPECAAFVREYLGAAPTVAGVMHVFARPDDAAVVRAWAEQFKDGAAMIYVDKDGALAKDLNVSGEPSIDGAARNYPATIVLDPEGKELFRSVGKSPRDLLAFKDFASRIAQRSRHDALADYNVPQDKPLAVEGYDVVAYFTQSKAVKGSSEFVSAYRGVTYRFSTPENRALFAAIPENYLPTYGGWCATAMGAEGAKVEIDPTNFKVKDGRLFLFYKSFFADALKDWNQHSEAWEPAADINWKKLTREDPIKPRK